RGAQRRGRVGHSAAGAWGTAPRARGAQRRGRVGHSAAGANGVRVDEVRGAIPDRGRAVLRPTDR
ncbi:hypothetical protein, partial [Streptomyces sp. NPDC002884]|uniref:hypothetical protein n=1 Tax=Streptomyces sp. NPDC002884 TaxID=3154544 RepID=UPI0033245792